MAQKPVPGSELDRLHASIGRDVGELRARWVRWTNRRRAADARHGIAERLGAHPEDIVSAALRTFRAVRMVQDALAGEPERTSSGVRDRPA